ncbi:S-adenosyl-L-methionine-dependent methyltransferase [Xylariaceae sp. FL0804]|nr:S-adenosyl-L-methionine-dependent methyltransferase [Xylariaceae sp. FL0804]
MVVSQERIVRYYQSFDTFNRSQITRNLTHFGPPSQLRERPESQPLAWTIARQMREPSWVWLESHPELAHAMGQCFMDVVDFGHEFGEGAEDSTPLLVDVGGGSGQQCIGFSQGCPALPGRVILQDLPQVYYFRNILHNSVDEDCRKILDAIKTGMTEKSIILIDETVLSEFRPPPTGALIDMTKMTTPAARERSKEDWVRFLDEAGFSLVKPCTYCNEYEDAELVAVPR